MYLVSLSQIFLFVIVECTSGPDGFDRRLAHMKAQLNISIETAQYKFQFIIN